MLTIATATTDGHFEQILAIQRRYHASTLPPGTQDTEGFVFAEHTVPVLRRMAALLPQAIALAGDEVVAYCLALHPSLRNEIPALMPMFHHFEQCSWQGRPLLEVPFFVGGQVCVDRAWRGRGILARLYRHLAQVAPQHLELCVTEVATRNQVSVRAHERMGFEVISRYADGAEDWLVVAWPFRPA